MASYRLKERFEGVRWMGFDTPDEDIKWLKALPDGPSNVKQVDFLGEVLMVTTGLTQSTLQPGDYIMYGNNRQPLVMPPNVFDMRYEVIDDGQGEDLPE